MRSSGSCARRLTGCGTVLRQFLCKKGEKIDGKGILALRTCIHNR